MAKLQGPWGDKNPLAVFNFTPAIVRVLRDHPEFRERTIKNQFRQLTFLFHPDHSGNEQLGRDLNEANALLTDPEKLRLFWGAIVKEFLEKTADDNVKIVRTAREELRRSREIINQLERKVRTLETQSTITKVGETIERIERTRELIALGGASNEADVSASSPVHSIDEWVINVASPPCHDDRSTEIFLNSVVPAFVLIQRGEVQELLFVTTDGKGYSAKIKSTTRRKSGCDQLLGEAASDLTIALVRTAIGRERDRRFLERVTEYEQRLQKSNAGRCQAVAYATILDQLDELHRVAQVECHQIVQQLKALIAYDWWPVIPIPTDNQELVNWIEYERYRLLAKQFRDITGWKKKTIVHRLNDLWITVRANASGLNKIIRNASGARPPLRDQVRVRLSDRELTEFVMKTWHSISPTYNRVIGSIALNDLPTQAVQLELADPGILLSQLPSFLPVLRPVLSPKRRLVGVCYRSNGKLAVHMDTTILHVTPLTLALKQARQASLELDEERGDEDEQMEAPEEKPGAETPLV